MTKQTRARAIIARIFAVILFLASLYAFWFASEISKTAEKERNPFMRAFVGTSVYTMKISIIGIGIVGLISSIGIFFAAGSTGRFSKDTELKETLADGRADRRYSPEESLAQLKRLYEKGQISDDEYKYHKRRILDKF